MRKLWLLLAVLLLSTAANASAQKFSFTMQNNSGLNFEKGSFSIELLEINQPYYIKVNLTSGGSSRFNNLYDSEAPIEFNQVKLNSSHITGTKATITIEFPDGWGYPETYTIVRPVVPVGKPDIVLSKTVDKTNLTVGDIAEFKIVVENTGNATAYNLTLTEQLTNGFSKAPGSRFPPVINTELAAGANQELYYALKAVESGSFNIEPAMINYGSKTNKSNSLIITVARIVPEKSNLTTVISLDKNNINTDDTVKVKVKMTNTGNVSAKSVLVEGTPPPGMKVIEGDLRQVYDAINPGETKEYIVTLKATETGSFSIHLRTVYNDDPIGSSAASESIIVVENNKNNLYIIIPIIVIAFGIATFAIKRHKEYSY